ncbi:MAG TPA: polymer-forming cytoskeletal protein [Bryobacteraceae bacterium]|jgi:cytoskeletal protein CcmA (bactofilin family)|nr:polymer-forming cytoskeletal protein [Bryobacteraceae bacterium]
MWSDRKQHQDAPKATPTLDKPEPSRPEVPIERAEPVPATEPRNIAVIGKGMVINGQIRSGEHMHISGEIDGSLYLAGYDLTVTTDSKVRADVTAREVDISGSIRGNVDATRKITVRKGGKLIGDLRTPGIVIEDGAYFKGNIEIVTREGRPNEDEVTSAGNRALKAHA